MSGRYTDSPSNNSGFGGGNGSSNSSSYTDRFRVDEQYPSDLTSSVETPGRPSGSSRPPTSAMLVTLIGMSRNFFNFINVYIIFKF